MSQKVLDAPDENWPVFPSFHRPTPSKRVTDALIDREYTKTEIYEMRADRSLIEVGIECDVAPPSTMIDARRHVLKRLRKEAGIEFG
jgi:hypothetical protein